ncbi:phage tail protein, partial [Escherichia coli]
MTVKYYAILTNQGAARLANATMLGSKLNLTQMAVGDANGVLPTPDPAQTKLINQKRIAPLNLLSIDPNNQNQIIAEQIIPENEGGFWIREIGLYDDEGVLIAVANCPETYKPQLQEGSGRTQTIRMILVVTNTEAITLKIDPSVVLATRKYVDDKISDHEQSQRHPDASLTVKGFTQLSSAIDSESETLAATPKAVKAAYDLANGKQAADATLTALAALATEAGKLPYFTGVDRASLTALTSVGRAILGKTSIQGVLDYLGFTDPDDGDSLVAVKQDLENAVIRNQHDKNAEIIS